MKKESDGFCYLRQKFPRITDANIKEGIFVGPQIISDRELKDLLEEPEKNSMEVF